MWILIVGIIIVGTIAAGVTLFFDKETPIVHGGNCESCSSTNTRCEQACMIEASVTIIEYFDDEELDAYKNRASDKYTTEEVEEFRHIMETLSASDLKAWSRSLTLRGINMPDEVKDEYILLTEGV